MGFRIHHRSSYLLSIYYSAPPRTKNERYRDALIIGATFTTIITIGFLASLNPTTIFIAAVISIILYGILQNSSKNSLKLHLDIGERQVIIEKTEAQELKRLQYDIKYFCGLDFQIPEPKLKSKLHSPAEIFLKFDDNIFNHERPSSNNLIGKAIQKIEGTKVLYWRIPLWETKHPTTEQNAHDIISEANTWLKKYLYSDNIELTEQNKIAEENHAKAAKTKLKVKRDFRDVE